MSSEYIGVASEGEGKDSKGLAAACGIDRHFIGYTAIAPDPGVTGPYGVTGPHGQASMQGITGMRGASTLIMECTSMSGPPPSPPEELPSSEGDFPPPCARPYETIGEASVLVGKVVATASYFEKKTGRFFSKRPCSR